MEENQSKFKKYLYNQIALILAIGGLGTGLIGIYKFVANPLQDLKTQAIELKQEELIKQLANLKDNDLHEIHLSLKRIEENEVQMGKDIVRLQTTTERLNKYLKE